MVKPEEIKKVCDSINDKADCSIKAGISSNNDSIVIYDSESYEELFGYDVLGNVNIESDNIYSLVKAESDAISKIAMISGKAIITAVQK